MSNPNDPAQFPPPTFEEAPPYASEHEAESRTAHMRARADDLQREFQARAAHLQDQMGDVDEQVRTFVREHPFAAIGAAVATGYVLGRIFSRFR